LKNFRVLLSLIIVALLALGFVTGCGSSDDGDGGTDTGNVTGTVTDNNGNPVNGATATVTTTDLKAVYTDTTDEDGLFLITGVPVGTWPLTITKSGYQTISVNVTFTSGSTYEVPANQTVITPTTGVGVVTGTVSDATSAVVIDGATVAIGTFNTTSTATGAYTLSGVTAGTQTITATKAGYENYTSTVNVVADTTVTKDIAMTSDTPIPGKGHVKGKVIDENDNALAGVTVTYGTTTTTTDANGEYTLKNLEPGAATLSFAKTGYDNATQNVTVVANQTITANTVTMTTGPTTGTTVLASVPRTTEIVGAGIPANPTRYTRGATVSDNGAYVTFISNQPLLATHITVGAHVYMFSRASSTVTMLDVDPNGYEGTLATAACNATDAFISGDASLVAFSTPADNLLGAGADANAVSDVFVYHRTTGIVSRVSVDYSNKLIGGYADANQTKVTGAISNSAGLSQDGGYVVFSSAANNIVSPGFYTDDGDDGAPDIHKTVNVYRVKLTQAADGTVTTSAPLLISGRQADGKECNPDDYAADPGTPRTSTSPFISRDGRFVTYISNAQPGAAFLAVKGDGNGAGQTLLADAAIAVPIYRDGAIGTDSDVFLCDCEKTATTRTTFVSQSATNIKQATLANACTLPTVSDDGTKVAFQCADNLAAWVTGNDDFTDCWVKNLSNGQLSRVSNAGSGTRGDSANPMISRDGAMVAFDSAGTGFVQNDTNATIDCFVYTIATGTFQRVNLSSNNEQSDNTGGVGSYRPFLSGDNNYVTFTSIAKNLTLNVYFTPAVEDVYLRKWQ